MFLKTRRYLNKFEKKCRTEVIWNCSECHILIFFNRKYIEQTNVTVIEIDLCPTNQTEMKHKRTKHANNLGGWVVGIGHESDFFIALV